MALLQNPLDQKSLKLACLLMRSTRLGEAVAGSGRDDNEAAKAALHMLHIVLAHPCYARCLNAMQGRLEYAGTAQAPEQGYSQQLHKPGSLQPLFSDPLS